MTVRTFVVLLVAALLAACSAEDSCACSLPETATYDVWLVDGDHLAATRVTVTRTGRPGEEALRALLAQPPTDRLFNAWNIQGMGSAARVVRVEHRKGVVRVELDPEHSLRDPYPLYDSARAGVGRLAVQQVVRTVQDALDTHDPVLLSVRGRPVRELWLKHLDQPVSRD